MVRFLLGTKKWWCSLSHQILTECLCITTFASTDGGYMDRSRFADVNTCSAMLCSKEAALRHRARVGLGARGAMGVGTGVRRWGCSGPICAWQAGLTLPPWVALWPAQWGGRAVLPSGGSGWLGWGTGSVGAPCPLPRRPAPLAHWSPLFRRTRL